MPEQKSVIIASKWLAGGVVDEFLTSLSGYQVHRLVCQRGAALLEAIEKYHPDVLIVDQTIRPACLNLALAQMAAHPDLRVVVVDIKQNRIEIFDHTQVHVTNPADFLAAL